ncbi:hypothetical protein [Maribacter sp. HTCC2170]|uniref:hypothetical protein n=1 Tax=Maribacter sp. (strain HTCC2170 / KCCM 42371) TaxID=313603 RepID=UPI0005A12A4F|nr:hypothetical protein [Maribacter sp. HTCC2170]
MKLLKQLFDFYLNASVHVALGVYCLLKITALLNDVKLDVHLSFFVFFGTISCYNFVKYGVEAKKYILTSNTYHQLIQVFSLISLAISLYHLFFLTLDSLYILSILLLLAGFYALPILPRAKNLRSLGGLKIFMVALIWGGMTVLLPTIEAGYDLRWDEWILLIQRIILVLILLLPFEIRDLAYDSPELRTIPQRIGVARTKLFGYCLIPLMFLLIFMQDFLTLIDVASNAVLCFILGTMIFFTKRNQSKYFSSFWVEGIPLLWLLVVLALKNFI